MVFSEPECKDETKRSRVSLSGKGKRREMYLHTFVMEITNPGSTTGMTVDHLNSNKLDNRRQNLEVVSAKENLTRACVKRYLKRKVIKLN